MDFKPRERIGGGTEVAMIMVATAIWLIGLIPFVDWFTDPLLWVIFWLWFKTSGASLAKNKVKNTISGVVSLIPTVGAFLGAFPVVIYMNIRTVKKEDKEFNAAAQAEQANSIRQQQYMNYISDQQTTKYQEDETEEENSMRIGFEQNNDQEQKTEPTDIAGAKAREERKERLAA